MHHKNSSHHCTDKYRTTRIATPFSYHTIVMENTFPVAKFYLPSGWRPAKRKTLVATRTKDSHLPAERISVWDITPHHRHTTLFCRVNLDTFFSSTSSSGSRATSICSVLFCLVLF